MKKTVFFLGVIISVLMTHLSYGQSIRYTTHTEAGVLSYGSPLLEESRFSAQTFQGVKLSDGLRVGIVLGVDKYKSYWMMPVSAGARYVLFPEQRNSVFFGGDIGYGLAWLNKKKQPEQSFRGGTMISPSIGVLFAKYCTVTISYKWQAFEENYELSSNNSRYSLIENKYDFSRLGLRIGLMF